MDGVTALNTRIIHQNIGDADLLTQAGNPRLDAGRVGDVEDRPGHVSTGVLLELADCRVNFGGVAPLDHNTRASLG